jgi:hypothetical protein
MANDGVDAQTHAQQESLKREYESLSDTEDDNVGELDQENHSHDRGGKGNDIDSEEDEEVKLAHSTTSKVFANSPS